MDFVKNLYRYKRLRHIAVGRHLLHDIAFSVHGLFCMEDKGLPRARLLRIVADLPNSIARHLMFQLSRREPTFVFAFEASLFAFANETPPFAFALLYPR